LSITPDGLPETRRVVELDGKSSLAALHELLVSSFELISSSELYGFSLNGRFDDPSALYVGAGAEGQRAERALLFRLGLRPGKRFEYVLGTRAARRFVIDVLAVDEVERPLDSPVLVEAVGSAAPLRNNATQVGDLVLLAEAFLTAHDQLEPFDELLAQARAELEPWEQDGSLLDEGSASPRHQRPLSVPPEAALLLENAAAAALTLLQVLGNDLRRFLALDARLSARSLGQRLLDLPLDLAAVGEHDRALEVCEALRFIDAELVQGDMAIVLARAGRREEALARVEENLSAAKDKSLVEAKAGDVHRALGDVAAAEAYYRRSLAEATTDFDRSQALLRLVTCLVETGRALEASQLLTAERAQATE
jgi:tetratricopeptide (TPR) repeat protein